MIRLFMLLIVGDWHRHLWDIYDTRRMYDDPKDSMATGTKYILRCGECGKMKASKL